MGGDQADTQKSGWGKDKDGKSTHISPSIKKKRQWRKGLELFPCIVLLSKRRCTLTMHMVL